MKSERARDALFILGFSALVVGSGAYAFKAGSTAPPKSGAEKVVTAH